LEAYLFLVAQVAHLAFGTTFRHLMARFEGLRGMLKAWSKLILRVKKAV